MKKTIAAIIIVGALLAGCATPATGPTATPTQVMVAPTATPVAPTEVPAATPTAIPTSTPTPTVMPTPEPTSTPIPVPTYTLSGTVFFDYNGNGLQDEGEPPIEGVPVSVAGLRTISGPDGRYSLVGVPAGSQQMYVESPIQEPATAFRYISLSLEAFQPIDEPIAVAVDRNAGLDIALMQGFLTLPVPCGTMSGQTKYVDLDHRLGFVRRWDGVTAGPSLPGQHPGIDYHGEMGTPILAAATGIVISVGDDQRDGGVRVVHDLGSEKFVTDYAHNRSRNVQLGDRVERGQTIAQMGNYGVVIVHLHFELWPLPASAESSNAGVIDYIFNPERWPWVQTPSGDEIPSGLDPYRDVLDAQSAGYWTVDNSPQCLP